jgi:hypothetical protein
MATILEFRASFDEVTPRPRRRKSRSAEIVIFPGIRYERWHDAEPAADPKRASTPRDVLKLVE